VCRCVLCVGACAAVCRCVLCVGACAAVCACVCTCRCVCICVCRCVLVCSYCADTGVCACFGSICSNRRVCVCAVCEVRGAGSWEGSHWRAGWSASVHTRTDSICDLASALCALPHAGHWLSPLEGTFFFACFVRVCRDASPPSPPSGGWE
jgi:hypothetical protein